MSRIDEIKERLDAVGEWPPGSIWGEVQYMLDRIAKLEAVKACAWELLQLERERKHTGAVLDALFTALAALDNDDEKEATHGD